MSLHESNAPESINDPHIPACILVDTSLSMKGSIDNINENLTVFGRQIGQDRQVGVAMDVCVIEFNDAVRVVQDWCSVRQMPKSFDLRAGGRTDLDGAVREGVRKIREREHEYLRRGIAQHQKPCLILLTDGEDTVTGNVHKAAEIVGGRIRDGKLKLFFLGYGEYNAEAARELTEEQPARNGQHPIMHMDKDDNDFDDFLRLMFDNLYPRAEGVSLAEDMKVEVPNFCLDDLLNS